MKPVSLRSFAKINLGLCIGPVRRDGFHELRTVYQTIALHDVVHITLGRGRGIELRCSDPRVPRDQSNTCWRMAEKMLQALKLKNRVVIEIEKRLPVQGGLGGASGNAAATLLGLERAAGKQLRPEDRLAIAAEVGSDVPLFLIGGTVMGVGRGEEVYPLPDLPAIPMVVATPEVGVATPHAFAEWDRWTAKEYGELTAEQASDRLKRFGSRVSTLLSVGSTLSGAPARGGSRVGSLLLDLVRTGIENDFERVVFPEYPELRDLKQALRRAGSVYASLSGSGSALYGLFRTKEDAKNAAARIVSSGTPAQATVTLGRGQLRKKTFLAG